MSVEITIICDGCAAIINGGKTAKAARSEVSSRADGASCQLGLPGGRDLCWDCATRSR